MFRVLIAALALLLALPACANAAQLDAAGFEDWYYQNPSALDDIGDPQIQYADGAYWCTATSSGVGYRVWRSADLLRWERQEQLMYDRDQSSWARGNFWAPEAYAYRGKYYLFFSSKAKGFHGHMCLGVAVSDEPGGPYVDLTEGPLVDPGYSVIDASFFLDDDGTPYLYFARDCSDNVVADVHESHIYGVRLRDDLAAIEGEPVLLARPDQAWEMDSGPGWLWNEGPALIKHGDKYCLFYSANFYAGKEYGVGYALSDSPLGPFEKAERNPLMQYVERGGVTLISGPGHNSFFEAPGGERFTAYHSHTDPRNAGDNRQMCLDRAGFNADGTPYINGPTLAPQLRPLAQLDLRNALPESAMEGGAGCLADGNYGISPKTDDGLYFAGEAGFAWDEPVTLRALVVYPKPGAVGKLDIAIKGGEVLTCDLRDAGDLPGANIRLHFDPVQASEIRVVSEGGLAELIALVDDEAQRTAGMPS